MPPRKNRNRRKKEVVDALANCVLPLKLIKAILSRLPVKSLVRFKGVCKPWNAMFTSPEFIKLHHECFAHAPKTWCANSKILSCRKLGLTPHKQIPGAQGSDQRPDDFFLASCRGLICLGRPLFNTDRVLLWNPATRMWKILPNPTVNYKGIPESSALGFGCNEEGDDHKVVRIFCMKGKKMKVFVEVYSSKSDRWKPMNVENFPFRVRYTGPSALVDGNPHWVASDAAGEKVLLRLDATRMQFKMLYLPEVLKDPVSTTFVDFGGLLGGLRCVKREEDEWLEWIDVSVYENDEWVMKWRLDGDALRGLPVESCVEYSWAKGKLVGMCINGCFFVYDLDDGSMELMGVERGARGLLDMYTFEESLAHVKGMAALNLATPVDDEDDDEINDCILDGFFTWVLPYLAGEVQVFYPLAS